MLCCLLGFVYDLKLVLHTASYPARPNYSAAAYRVTEKPGLLKQTVNKTTQRRRSDKKEEKCNVVANRRVANWLQQWNL